MRRQALANLKEYEVLMTDGHFDYGNGFHGPVYLNPHRIFCRPSLIWRFAQDLIDVLPDTLQVDIIPREAPFEYQEGPSPRKINGLYYLVYARGLDLELIRMLHRAPPLDRLPDRTILLDLDPAVGLDRARRRNDDLGLSQAEGRFEREGSRFHERVREGYLSLAESEPFRFRIVAAEGSTEAVESRVADLLSDLFPSLDDEEPS